MSELGKTDPPEDGVYQNVSMAEYRAWDAINFSSIAKGRKSMLAMHHAMTQPSESTASQGLGTAVHAAVLEPDLFDSMPVFDGNRTARKTIAAFEAEHGECVTAAERESAMRLRDILMADSEAQRIVKNTLHEVCLVWRDPAYGVGKIRLDMFGNYLFADIKTARDISFPAMDSSFFSFYKWGYYMQFGWAREAIEHLEGHANGWEGWLLAVETGDVPDAYTREVEGAVMMKGQEDAREIAKTYNTHRVMGWFPGVARGDIGKIDLPTWMQPDPDAINMEGISA